MTANFAPPVAELPMPRILLAGVGPRMIAAAGRVADGFLSHPFQTPASVATITLPALQSGCAASGRVLSDLEVTCALIGIAGETHEERIASREAARAQVAFYGSTPAYAPVLETEGLGDLHVRLHACSKQGRWDEMAALVDDDVLDLICISGTPDELLDKAQARAAAWADRVTVIPSQIGANSMTPIATARWHRRFLAAARGGEPPR